MIGADTLDHLTPLIIALVSAGGIFGGIVALLRVRPESGKLVVEAAEGAVIVQSGVIESLREELGELSERLDTAREDLDAELERRERCETRLDECDVVLDELRRRLERAEAAVEGVDRPADAPPSGPQTTS